MEPKHLPLRTILATSLIPLLFAAGSPAAARPSEPSAGLPAPRALPERERKDLDEGERERKLVPELEGADKAFERYKNLVEEGEANLKEIQKLLDEIQKGLADRETGAETQKKQKEVVEKMQALLEELEKNAMKGSSSSSSSSSQKPQGDMQEKQQGADEKPSGEQQEPKEQQKTPAQLQESEKERKEGQVENERVGEEDTPEARARALREQLLRISSRWGVLPAKLREEALFSTGTEAPREYIEIIARYYKRLTEFYEQGAGER